MRTLEFYFSAPDYSGPDPKLQWEPSPMQWYNSFIDALHNSKYSINKYEIHQEINPHTKGKKIEVIVEGSKR